MNNAGFEKFLDLLPPRMTGPVRGVLFRVVKLLASANQVLFNFIWPLPTVSVSCSTAAEEMHGALRLDLRAHEINRPVSTADFQALETNMKCDRPAARWSRLTGFLLRFRKVAQQVIVSPEPPDDFSVFLFERKPFRAGKWNWKGFRAFQPRRAVSDHSCEESSEIAPGRATSSSGSAPSLPLRPSGESLAKLSVQERASHDFYYGEAGSLRSQLVLEALHAAGKLQRPPLTQRIDDRPYLDRGEIFFGLGDIFLGMARLHQEALKSNRLPLVDWSSFSKKNLLELASDKHPEKNWFSDRPLSTQINSSAPLILPLRSPIFTNRRPNLPLSPATIRFLRENGGTPSRRVRNRVQTFLNRHELNQHSFDIAHVRFGDPKTQKEDISALIRERIIELSHESTRLVIVSDQPGRLSDLPFKKNVTIRQHSIKRDGKQFSDQEFLTVLEDFFLLMEGRTIFSFSRYAWGSAFCQVASLLSGSSLTPVVTHRRQD